MKHVMNGVDVFLRAAGINKKSRTAVVTNNAAFTSEKLLSRLALIKEGFNLVKIFSPEHGISVKGEDGVYQNHSLDIKTNLPIISLYGDRLAPTEEDLHDIDIVLFDIPDVGCRFYTYLWTMTYIMEACAKYHKQLIILDRPNPITGKLEMAEGPMLDEENCSSFIGRWSIPVRHSCTLGELANYFLYKKVKGLDLKIIKAQNWRRDQLANDFYPTSPAIQNIQTALIYPGMGLLEGINVNEGRGTEKPFLQFGAPWLDAGELINEIELEKPIGITLRKVSFIPADSLYKNEECFGLAINLPVEQNFRPVSFGINLIAILLKLYPARIAQRAYITNANPTGAGHLDKLIGIQNSFNLLKSGVNITTNTDTWKTEISSYLLYN